MLQQFVIGLLMCVCLDLVQSQDSDRGILGKHVLSNGTNCEFLLLYSIHGEGSNSTPTAQC